MFEKKRPRSFLVINPFGIGDVIFSTPLVQNLHALFPSADIYYMCNKRVAPLLEHHPLIKKLFIYERDDFEKIRKESLVRFSKAMLSFLDEIRKEHIDVAIDLSLNTKFGLYAWYAGIRKRIGFDYKKRGWALTKRVAIEGFQGKHVAEIYLDILRAIKVPVHQYPFQLCLHKDMYTWAHQECTQHAFSGKRIIGVVPCGGESFGKQAGIKRWPPEKFAELCNQLIAQCDARIIIMTGPKEKEETECILRGIEQKQAVFDTSSMSIVQLAALVEMCDLVISNDTGPLRFANAYDKKIIALFGPVNEVVYGLYPFDETKHSVLAHPVPCRPCYERFRLKECTGAGECLTGITVDEVLREARRLLKVCTDARDGKRRK